jgi:hypothetical protein
MTTLLKASPPANLIHKLLSSTPQQVYYLLTHHTT